MTSYDIVPVLGADRCEGLTISYGTVKDRSDCLVLFVQGSIDDYTADFTIKCVEKAIQNGFRRLVFDLSRYTYMAHSKPSTLTHFYKSLHARGGKLVIARLDPKIHEVWSLLGYAQFFTIEDTLEEAILICLS